MTGYRTQLKEMKSYTEYAPWWVILTIAISLGLGTMVGWNRYCLADHPAGYNPVLRIPVFAVPDDICLIALIISRFSGIILND